MTYAEVRSTGGLTVQDSLASMAGVTGVDSAMLPPNPRFKGKETCETFRFVQGGAPKGQGDLGACKK